MKRRPLSAATVVLALAAVLAGCGSSASPQPSSASPATPAATAAGGAASATPGSVAPTSAPAASETPSTPAPVASSSAPAASPSGSAAPGASSAPSPAASQPPAASAYVPATPLAFTRADLSMDHAAATSSRGSLYSRPLQGCRPTAFAADPAKSSFTVSPDGALTAHCEQDTATGAIDGDLTGSIDPATGAVTFTLTTKTVFKGAKPAVFALTFQGTGAMSGPDAASGTATWTMTCTAGTAKCSFDPAYADALTAKGTVPWTIAFLP